jgi:hypothetical protein
MVAEVTVMNVLAGLIVSWTGTPDSYKGWEFVGELSSSLSGCDTM